MIFEISRITKSDGYIEIFVPFMHRYHKDPKDYIRLTHKYLEQIILENGLKIEKLVLIGVGPLSVISEIILKYLKFNIIKIPVFFYINFIDNIIKYFSKDYKDYYLECNSCKK